MSHKIREAIEDDIEEVMRLLFQINTEHYEQAPRMFGRPEENDPNYWLKQVLDPEQLFLVSESDGRLTGMITAGITTSSDVPFLSHHKVCRVGTIVVDHAHRRSGVGRSLMAHAEGWAKSKGAVEIRLLVMEFNERAQAFYFADGFETQSRNLSKNIV